MLSWNRWASWATTPIESRSDCRVRSRTSTPPIRIDAGIGVVDPRNQLRDGGFAGAGRADQRDELPGVGAETHPVQHRVPWTVVGHRDVLQGGQRYLIGAGIGEVHVVEFHRLFAGGSRAGVRALDDQRLQIEHLEDPFERDESAHHIDPDVRQRHQRSVQPAEQQRQRDDGAGLERAVQRQRAAETVGEGLRERGHQAQRDDEHPPVHRRRDPDVANPAGPLVEGLHLIARPTEQRHQQRPRHVEPFGRGRVHRGVQPVALASEGLQLAPEPPGRENEDRQQDQREHRDLPGQAEHHHRGQGESDGIGDDAGQGRGESLLRTDDVVVESADQGAGLGAGEERQRHLLHVPEHLGAHVEDQALADPGREPAGAEGQQRVQHGQAADHQRQSHHHGHSAAGADLVDHVAGEQRGGDADHRRHDRQQQEDAEFLAVRGRERHHPAQRAGRELLVLHRAVLVPHSPGARAGHAAGSGHGHASSPAGLSSCRTTMRPLRVLPHRLRRGRNGRAGGGRIQRAGRGGGANSGFRNCFRDRAIRNKPDTESR